MSSVRFSLAADVGGIELMHASYRGHRFPPHFHDAYSVSVTRRGGLAFDFRGCKHVAGSGIISAVDPGEVHNAYPAVEGVWTFVCLLIPATVMESIAAQAGGGPESPGFPRRVIDDPQLATALNALHGALEASPDTLLRQSLAVMTLAGLLRRHSTAAAPPPPRRHGAIARARELLDEPAAERITLERASAIAGLSPYHFLRTFRAEVGLTPHAYLNHVRVARARKLLARGIPPAQVALSCGFCDQSHLGRLFKAHLGVTPGQYREAVRSPGAHSPVPPTPRR
jgi:AraC-like DNA-binding protein